MHFGDRVINNSISTCGVGQSPMLCCQSVRYRNWPLFPEIGPIFELDFHLIEMSHLAFSDPKVILRLKDSGNKIRFLIFEVKHFHRIRLNVGSNLFLYN